MGEEGGGGVRAIECVLLSCTSGFTCEQVRQRRLSFPGGAAWGIRERTRSVSWKLECILQEVHLTVFQLEKTIWKWMHNSDYMGQCDCPARHLCHIGHSRPDPHESRQLKMAKRRTHDTLVSDEF